YMFILPNLPLSKNLDRLKVLSFAVPIGGRALPKKTVFISDRKFTYPELRLKRNVYINGKPLWECFSSQSGSRCFCRGIYFRWRGRRGVREMVNNINEDGGEKKESKRTCGRIRERDLS
ncbi:MAG: hypothetical protein ACPLKX_09195, partial [Dictyoglomaceae bacterium]